MEQQLTVPAGHRPRLVLLGDVRRQGLQGVLRLCMENAGTAAGI